ncbi:hypothetical protein ES703_75666 [subsurface metagenome]
MTEFPCPVENCTSVFEDWMSLQGHLSEAHKQDTTQEQYEAWRETVTEQESEQRQRQRQETEQDDKGTLIESDVPVRGDLEKSFQSVKMHAVRSHGEKLTRADLGLPPEEEKKPARRSSYEHKEAEKEEGFFEPTETDAEPFVRMPDVYQAIWQHVRMYGLTKKGADTFVDMMKTRDADNLVDWEEALVGIGASQDKIKLITDNWARKRGLGPYGRGYGGYDGYRSGYRGRYDRQDKDWQPKPQDEVSQLLDKEYDELRRIRVIQALQGGGEDSSEIKMLRDELRRGTDSRVEELEKRLAEEKELRHRQEIEGLRQEFDLKFESLRKEEGGLIERQAVRAIERVGDVSEKLVGIGERIVVGAAFKHNLLQEEAPVPRERGGHGGIADLVPREYLEIEQTEGAG